MRKMRVFSIFGDWEQGKFCMVFVGALNVGSIELNFDPELKINSGIVKPYHPFALKEYSTDQKGG